MYAIRRAPFVLRSGARPYSTPSRTRARHSLRITLVTSAISAGALFGLYSDAKSCPSPPFELAGTTTALRDVSPPLLTLFRSYLVYGITSFETIADNAPEILETLLKIPVLGMVVEGVVRHTFFSHFVGGETARDTLPLLSMLRSQNKGAMFGYSVEVDAHEAVGDSKGSSSRKPSEPVHKRIVAEMIRSVDIAADFEDESGTRDVVGRRTWVAVKLTALLPDANALRNLSLHLTRTRPVLSPPVPFPGTPGSSDLVVLHGQIPENSPLTAQDVEDLKELYNDLNKICARGKNRNVRIVLDAEYSWYQPAIDAFGHALMERYNKLPDRHSLASTIWSSGTRSVEGPQLQPVVYVTYQAYLRRNPTHLARSLALAQKNNYALGVKLVRGAYQPHEVAAHAESTGISRDPYPPVHPSKPDTDACYDECAALLVRAISNDIKTSAGRPPHIGVLFGTHNWSSCEKILEELVNSGMAHETADANHEGTITVPVEVAERLTFGQLHAMVDSLANYLVLRVQSTTPFVVKYIPYGALAEVMPYISRRAVENKSVLGSGGAVRERKEAARLIWKRVFGGIGL